MAQSSAHPISELELAKIQFRVYSAIRSVEQLEFESSNENKTIKGNMKDL